MPKPEIRSYEGDFEDILELARRVWIPIYSGKTWFPLPGADFLREKFAPARGGFALVAYEGSRAVGSVCAASRVLRVCGVEHKVGMFSSFTVEPDARRVALPLIERLRRTSAERGETFGIGMTLRDPATTSNSFWTKYAEAFPQKYRFVFESSYFAKFLRPEAIARAGVKRWERLASRAFGPLLRMSPFGLDPAVRPYRPSDLDRCEQLVAKSLAGVEWAMVWSREQLAAQLHGPSYTTLVYEREGVVQAMVSCHAFPLRGRDFVRCAFIDLWGEDDVTASGRARLIGHLCKHLEAAGVEGVIATRSASMPIAALLANLFLPGSEGFKIGVFPTSESPPLAPPASWSFELV